MSAIARATLTSGSAHDDVYELGQLLARCGFENSVSRGQNAFGVVDESVLTAVNAFRSKHSVAAEEDIPGVPHEQRRNWIGPEFWDALVTEAGNLRKGLAAA